MQLPLVDAEDLRYLVEPLGPLEEQWHPVGAEWEGIIQLWQKVIAVAWVLYSRDKLSLGIRSLVRNSAAIRQVRVHFIPITIYFTKAFANNN